MRSFCLSVSEGCGCTCTRDWLMNWDRTLLTTLWQTPPPQQEMRALNVECGLESDANGRIQEQATFKKLKYLWDQWQRFGLSVVYKHQMQINIVANISILLVTIVSFFILHRSTRQKTRKRRVGWLIRRCTSPTRMWGKKLRRCKINWGSMWKKPGESFFYTLILSLNPSQCISHMYSWIIIFTSLDELFKFNYRYSVKGYWAVLWCGAAFILFCSRWLHISSLKMTLLSVTIDIKCKERCRFLVCSVLCCQGSSEFWVYG